MKHTINLLARIQENIIQVYIVGKWRNIRWWHWRSKSGWPSKKIMREVGHTVYLNTHEIHSRWKEDDIEFEWQWIREED